MVYLSEKPSIWLQDTKLTVAMALITYWKFNIAMENGLNLTLEDVGWDKES